MPRRNNFHEGETKTVYSPEDYKLMREGIQKCGSWLNWMESRGYIKWDKDQNHWFVIVDPVNYTFLNEARVKMEAKDSHDQETFFQQFPEERVAWQTRISTLLASLRV